MKSLNIGKLIDRKNVLELKLIGLVNELIYGGSGGVKYAEEYMIEINKQIESIQEEICMIDEKKDKLMNELWSSEINSRFLRKLRPDFGKG